MALDTYDYVNSGETPIRNLTPPDTTLSPVESRDVGNRGPVASVETTSSRDFVGPTADLYKNPYDKTSICYPKDLDSLDKGHAIQFNIREIKPFKTTVGAIESKLKEMKSNAEAAYQTTTGGVADKGLAVVKSVGSDVMVETEYESVSDKSTVVRLYMPDTLSFNYAAQYDKLSLADAINSTPLVGKISTAITSMMNNNMAKLIGKKLGYTFNPQQQMLFEGIDFREFDLQFTFTPTSPDEAANVKEIIRVLKRSAAPTKMTGMAGFFWKPPSVFDLTFYFNGRVNPNVPPVLRCALQSITVDYAPNGWSALSDGAPVQTTMSLSFKEIELLDRDRMDQLEQETKSRL